MRTKPSRIAFLLCLAAALPACLAVMGDGASPPPPLAAAQPGPMNTEADRQVNRLAKEAMYLRQKGDLRGALKNYQEAYRIANDAVLDRKTNDSYAFLEMQIAGALSDLGSHAQAREHAEMSMASMAVLGRPVGDFEMCESRHLLALIEGRLGNHVKALDLHDANLKYQAVQPALKDPSKTIQFRIRPHSSTLNALGHVNHELHQFKEAEKHYRAALEIREAFLGREPELLANSYSNLAAVLIDTGRHNDAQEYVSKAFEQHERLSPTHPRLSLVLQNQAVIYRFQGHFQRAEAIYRHLADDHKVKGRLLLEANTYDLRGALNVFALKIDTAELSYRKALDLYGRATYFGNPQTIALLNAHGILLDLKENHDEALAQLDAARRATRHHVLTTLPALPESLQADYLNSRYRADMHGPLSFCMRSKDKVKGVPEHVAEWLANGKAVGHEGGVAATLRAREINDPAHAAKAKTLQDVRKELATRWKEVVPTKAADAHKQLLAGLAKEEEKLASELRRAGLERTITQPWVPLDDVRRRLPKDAVVLDLYRYSPHDHKARFFPGKKPYGEPRYLACVYGAQGAVKLLDLGEAEAIEKDIFQWQVLISTAGKDLGNDAKAAMEQSEECLGSLAERLAPALDAMKGSKRWLIGPDGPTWLVPWAALPVAKGKFAVEEHDIQYVTSVRDVLLPAANVKAAGAALFVNIDYDAKVQQPAADNVVGENPVMDAKPPFKKFDIAPAALEAMKSQMKKYVGGGAVRVHQDDNATKAAFLRVKSPRVLMLSTHGFFAKDDAEGPLADFGVDPPCPGAKRPANPMLRGALAFAGANKDGAGVATALEIAGMDLRGTEMVVLSACEAGVGTVELGEGIAGLRQAFLYSGAESVVATLWKIPVDDSSLLMESFWVHLGKGADRSAALAIAQRETIDRLRKGFANKMGLPPHPHRWAGFTLTGQLEAANNAKGAGRD